MGVTLSCNDVAKGCAPCTIDREAQRVKQNSSVLVPPEVVNRPRPEPEPSCSSDERHQCPIQHVEPLPAAAESASNRVGFQDFGDCRIVSHSTAVAEAPANVHSVEVSMSLASSDVRLASISERCSGEGRKESIDEPEPAPEDAGLVQTHVREKAQENGTGETECDVTWENRKSAVALGFVVVFWTSVLCGLSFASAAWEEPQCPVDAPRVVSCKPCGSGTLFLPLFGEYERSYKPAVRAVFYFVGLVWAFLGVGVVCDQFMGAIEEITSDERPVPVEVRPGTLQMFYVKTWNDTVANLSLMALGSSAPEILLSVIEIAGNDFFAGELGPSTIVGSAAFNLFMITAVCVSAIPAPDVRKVDQTGVFFVTAMSSIFAYVWMIIVLQFRTKDLVDIEEAFLTLLMFPALCLMAFAADKGWFSCCRRNGANEENSDAAVSQWEEEERRKIEDKFGDELPPATMNELLARARHEKDVVATTSKKAARKSVMSNFVGGGKTVVGATSLMETPTIGFAHRCHAVFECAGALEVKVTASKPWAGEAFVKYRTVEASAKAGVRFRHAQGLLRFSRDHLEEVIHVPLIDDDRWQADENFSIELFDFETLTTPQSGIALEPILGIDTTTVTVLNDDIPGTLSFDMGVVHAHEDTDVTLRVVRTNGNCGRIVCKYKSVSKRAVGEADFEAVEGELVFDDGEVAQTITMRVLGSTGHNFDSDDSHQLELTSETPGVKFDADTEGGEEMDICRIVILSASPLMGLCRCFSVDRDVLFEGLAEWRDQYISALYCDGSAEDQAKTSKTGWMMHVVGLTWKLLFAVVPPPCMFGGWLCFSVALLMIGVVTAFIGDLASLLGCCLSIPDDITAITLVALGTSLPDMLASKMAAQQDETADNSVGNVTGSNSVNVFLGLGLPWSMAAVHWKFEGATSAWKSHEYKGSTYEELYLNTYPQGGFLMPSGSLSTSVAVFACGAAASLVLLAVRRYLYGGELGGPKASQLRDSGILACLWGVYIVSSIFTSFQTK
eukprot:TRINITY_DN33374_c0_g1_i1.p1 TRINITY_DN33374_c0_g1~~TRINITY_DN33374_c0_g1_i1.p1  ORF type:complete len:1013 (+),score=200.09 TRINITY_DN33374_c0_g1_i1:201-3239(+)